MIFIVQKRIFLKNKIFLYIQVIYIIFSSLKLPRTSSHFLYIETEVINEKGFNQFNADIFVCGVILYILCNYSLSLSDNKFDKAVTFE
jgi:hypothetical protein